MLKQTVWSMSNGILPGDSWRMICGDKDFIIYNTC